MTSAWAILGGIEMVHRMRKGQAEPACNSNGSPHRCLQASPAPFCLQSGFTTERRDLVRHSHGIPGGDPGTGLRLQPRSLILSSVDLWALLLSLAAVVAMFRFQVGMILTLMACSITGMILYLLDMT